MTDLEKAIFEHAKAIYDIVKEADYPSGYLALSIFTHEPSCGSIAFNNIYYDEDAGMPIDFYASHEEWLNQEADDE